MKSIGSSAVLVLLTLIAAGCGGKNDRAATTSTPASAPKPGDAEGLVGAYLADMRAMTALFKRVTDEPSARENGPEIRAISVRLNGYATQMKTIDPTKKGMAFAARAADFMQIQQEMAPELQRISRDETLAKHLGDAMRPPKIN